MTKDIPDVQFATYEVNSVCMAYNFSTLIFSRLCLRGLHGSHRLFAFELGHGT